MIENSVELVKENERFVRDLDKRLGLRKCFGRHWKHLDFGCGYGFFIKSFCEKFRDVNVVGIDSDLERIKEAIKYFGVKRARYICGNKITGKFNSISTLFVLHEIKNLSRILREIYFHLNIGGKVIVLDFKKTSKKDFRKLFDKEWDEGDDFEEEYKEHNKWSVGEFRRIMEKVGFKTLKMGEYKKNYLYYFGEK